MLNDPEFHWLNHAFFYFISKKKSYKEVYGVYVYDPMVNDYDTQDKTRCSVHLKKIL